MGRVLTFAEREECCTRGQEGPSKERPDPLIAFHIPLARPKATNIANSSRPTSSPRLTPRITGNMPSVAPLSVGAPVGDRSHQPRDEAQFRLLDLRSGRDEGARRA